MSLRRLLLAIPPLPEALTPATARPVATQRVAVVISPPDLAAPPRPWGLLAAPDPGCRQLPCLFARRGSGGCFCLLPAPSPRPFPHQTKSCFANRSVSLSSPSPVPPPRPHLKSSPRGQGRRQLRKRRAGREPARPAVSANKVAFTNEQEDPIIMVLIIANIVTGLALKTSKSSSVNPRVYLFIPPPPLPEVN